MTNNSEQQTTTDWAGKKVFTTGEAASLCKVSQQTIIRCFDAGRLNGFRVPGSKFRRIPREELLRFMRANEIPTDALEGGSLRKILVVDDEPEMVEMLGDLLGADGRYEVTAATTGYDAGLLTERLRPHLLILDYLLPDINGNIVCKRLRENEDLRDTRVLIVSGVIEKAEVEKLLSSGADDFLRKPFEASELLSKVERLTGAKAGGV